VDINIEQLSSKEGKSDASYITHLNSIEPLPRELRRRNAAKRPIWRGGRIPDGECPLLGYLETQESVLETIMR
jgi:hypothetical protein